MRTGGLLILLTLVVMLTACGGAATTEPTSVPIEPIDDAPATPVVEPTTADVDPATPEPEPAEEEEPTEAAMAPTAAADPATTNNAQPYVIVSEESQVTYTVDETFIREGNRLATAIGVTQIISGAVTLDPGNPQAASISPITIDISAFTSDSPRRDDAIRNDWLESAQYPIATFAPTNIQGLPATYTEGEEITLQIMGDLTVRETTQPVTFDFTGQLANKELTGTATTNIKMTDFGFDPPDIANILRAEDDVLLTFDLVARPDG